MSGKLDQSLDEILSNQRRNQQGRRRSQRRAAGATRSATTAPAGGIQKSSKAARTAAKPTPAKGAGLTGESKIMVSNLVSRTLEMPHSHPDSLLTFPQPKDVSEGQIKVCYYR
jgi:hypothetical protein